MKNIFKILFLALVVLVAIPNSLFCMQIIHEEEIINEEVSYKNKSARIVISGTLTLPNTEGPFPAVLLIPGTGPVNRDQEGRGHKPFLILAEYLTRQGIAVLRVDKRGVGKTTGSYEKATQQDFMSDVLAGINYLKSRDEINPKQIGLIGHSEGAVIAPRVALKTQDVAFLVMMAGDGVSADVALIEQTKKLMRVQENAPEDAISQVNKLQKDLIDIAKEESDQQIAKKIMTRTACEWLKNLPVKLKPFFDITPETVINLEYCAEDEDIALINSTSYRSLLGYDPVTVLSQITIPVLVLNGERDLHVPPDVNLPVIEKALKKAGNKDYTIIKFPKLNHLFQTSKTGKIESYKENKETIAPVALNTISKWILLRTINKKSSWQKFWDFVLCR
jgi:pimeloyl-ACP methyl ester carboxylesterase